MPRKITASTSGCDAASSRIFGTVSRVSPPAMSTGLLRLHRGGSSASMAAIRSSGSGASSRSVPAMASAATTPQPPTVVTTTTRLPRGRGWEANVAATSKPSSTVRARATPGLADRAVEHTVVAGQRTGVAGRRPLAAGRGAALDDDDRLALGHAPEALGEGSTVADALDVGQADPGLGVGGEVLEVVGHGDGGGVAGGHGPADADARELGVVLERADEVARLAGDADVAGRRERTDDLGAQPGGRRHDALTVGAGQQDAELVGERHQVGLGREALLPRLAVPGGGDEGRRDALLGAGAQQVGVGGRGRAHEDEVDLAVGQVVDVGDRLHAEHLGAVAVGGEDLALVAAGQDVVQADEPELARVGGRARRRGRRGARTGPGTARGRCRSACEVAGAPLTTAPPRGRRRRPGGRRRPAAG